MTGNGAGEPGAALERRSVLQPKGRLDMIAAPTFREQVKRLVEMGASLLVVDLGSVSFVDSTGLAALVGALKLVRGAGGDLCVARPNAQVWQVVERRYLHTVLRRCELGEAELTRSPEAPR